MRTARPSLALVAALLAASASAFAAADLGVLFHTPQERARLDKLRRGEATEPVAAIPRKHEVTGYVRRSDGRNTVWINGTPVTGPGTRDDALMDPSAVGSSGNVKVERSKGSEVKR